MLEKFLKRAACQVDCDGLRRRAEILGGLREEVLQAPHLINVVTSSEADRSLDSLSPPFWAAPACISLSLNQAVQEKVAAQLQDAAKVLHVGKVVIQL